MGAESLAKAIASRGAIKICAIRFHFREEENLSHTTGEPSFKQSEPV